MGSVSLPLCIDNAEKMYRHLNLMPEGGGRATEMDEPPSYPDDVCSDKYFVFLHGYNVSPENTRGWAAEMFKRLWWSGSNAKYIAVTWEGAEGFNGSFTPNYHMNVENAFAAANAFKVALDGLHGQKIVAAHSLGNMLVSSAVSDWGGAVDIYFAIDAAVAIEAWNGSAVKSSDMVHLEWDNPASYFGTYDERLFASQWHALWPASDGRSKLTWRDRFANFGDARLYNFYSSGEEVLETHPHSDDPELTDAGMITLPGRRSWALQEKLKGRMHTGHVLGSETGGWGFTNFYNIKPLDTLPTGAQAASITDSQLRDVPFFRAKMKFGSYMSLDLFGPNGSQYAEQNRNSLLATAFPARTLPIGANPVPSLDADENFDMNTTLKSGWPVVRTRAGDSRWRHSDVRDVPYTYVFKLFDKMVSLGSLRD